MDFSYQSLPVTVIFGELAELAGQVRELGCSRAVVLSTPGRRDLAATVLESLGELGAGIVADARMHTPVETTTAAVDAVRELGGDCLVAVGGGSTVGLGKAIALRTDLPQVVLPTTYSGSEVTPVVGETADGVKRTRRTLAVLPEVVLYDVSLSLSLPVATSVTSLVNAMAHAVEARYTPTGNPVTSLLAERSVEWITQALPAIVADPGDRAARTKALQGSWLAGTCLATVGMALHHKLCHVLGGTFGLPHAETHTVVLPYAVAYNEPAVRAELRGIGSTLGATDDVAGALRGLLESVGAPLALRDLGMPSGGIDRAVELAMANPYGNPRPLAAEPLRALLTSAWAGDWP